MNLHFATSPSRIHINVLKNNNAKKLLFSYAFIKRPDKLIELLGDYRPSKIILDSGAFSVWSNGGTVNLEEYAQFCVGFKQGLDSCVELNVVNLDVLPGKWGFVPTKQEIADSAEKGWNNMLYLESLGLKVIHVFHQHEDFEILNKLKAHSDYIGISPANDVSMAEKLNWLNKVFLNIKGTVKTHGFAVTSHKQLYNYPFYSVDSSSWVTPARFGRIPILTDRNEVKSVAYKNINDIEKYWSYLSSIGIEKIAHPRWEDRVGIGIRTFLRLEEIATDLWARRGISWDTDVDNSVVETPISSYTIPVEDKK